MARKYTLMSSDGHLEVPPERWVHRVPEKYRDRAPRTVRLPDGGDAQLIEGQPLLEANFLDLRAGRSEGTWQPFGLKVADAAGTGSAEQLAEIAALISAARGRTLGLFSSMRAATAAAEQMRERLSTPILCQGDDATAALVEQFAAEPETSLFGTLSLWQGVDVPGPSLSLVIIDRIPFPRPDDPLLSARQRAVTARGGNGFMAVAASHAALLLAQGSGRLLRRVDDRGVVAVLDSRMATARYGGFLRDSLPPFWFTTDHQTVLAALDRLTTGANTESLK